MSDNFNNEYVECPKCEHQNPLNLSKCEICGYKLKRASVSPIAYLGVCLLLIGALGYGYFAVKEQFFPETTTADSNTSNTTEDVNRRSNGTIKVLGDTFSGYSTLRSTALQDALKKSGITLQYADEFDQAQRAEALNQGKADLMVTSLDQFLEHQPQGKIVALIDRTVGADAIVLNTREFPQLKSLIDLEKLVKQKQSQGQRLKIVFAGDTPSEFLATVLDTKFDNFDLVDFEVVRVSDASEAWQQMQAPQSNIGLAVLWEPFVTAARKQGNTVLLSSADAPKVIVDVAVASESLRLPSVAI